MIALSALAGVLVALGVALWPAGGGRAGQARPPGVPGRAMPGAHHPAADLAGPRTDPSQRPTVSEVAAACDLVSLALAAGAPIDRALTCVAGATDDRTGAALRALAAARAWGIAPDAAARLLHDGWEPLVGALALADGAGIPPSGVLRRAAADLRIAQHRRIGLAIARLRVQVVLPLGLCFLPAFVLTTIVPVVLHLTRQVVSP